MSNENKQNDERAAFVCRDLTDEDMDKLIGWLAEHDSDEIGHQGLCERIISAFARATQQATTGDERAEFDGMTGIDAAKRLIVRRVREEVGNDTFSAYIREVLAGDFAIEVAKLVQGSQFECAARKQGTAGGNDPADCDWPHCGCDEHANRVIGAIAESMPTAPSPVAGSAGQAPIYQVSDGASWNDTDWLEFQSTPAEDRRIVHEVSGDGSGVSLPTINTVRLPDGSGFAVASLPIPKDHWLYAARCAEWDEERDTTADTPHPILSHGQRDAVVAAVRYAVRGATMCGKESDFDPDALVQNAVYALCGPYGGVMEISTPTAPSLATDAGAVTNEWIAEIACDTLEMDYDRVPARVFAFARALLAAHPEQRMSDAARDVLAERARQVNVEGLTPARDDRYDFGQLASAASCYAVTHRWTRIDSPPPAWPGDWARSWWKPTTPRRDLVKAGALVLAEIERIDRAARNAEIERQGGEA